VVRAYEAGADFKRFADELAAHARNLVLASLPGVKQDLPDHEVRSLADAARAQDPAQLARVFELVQQAQDDVAKAETPRHALEVALLRAVHLAPSGTLPELVHRVEQLSARVGGAAPRVETAAPRASPDAPRAPAFGVRTRAENGAALRASSRTADADDSGDTSPGETNSAADPAAKPAADSAAKPAADPAAKPAAAATSGTLDERWRALVDAVRGARKMTAAAALERGVPLRIEDGTVEVGFRNANDALALEDRDTRSAVEAAFARALGGKVSLRIQQTPEAAPASLHDEKERARSERRGQRLKAGREHPAVRSAVELLGGEIEDVRDLGEE
jgi:DNA polymerase III gamma/tau subunit